LIVETGHGASLFLFFIKQKNLISESETRLGMNKKTKTKLR